MKISTTRFGNLTIEDGDVLTFVDGLIGMEDCRRWVLLADAHNSALGWLQSLDRPEVALGVVSPRRFVPDYQVRVARSPESVSGANTQSITLRVGSVITPAPSFPGVYAVTDTGECTKLVVSWRTGTAKNKGSELLYDVYRTTSVAAASWLLPLPITETWMPRSVTEEEKRRDRTGRSRRSRLRVRAVPGAPRPETPAPGRWQRVGRVVRHERLSPRFPSPSTRVPCGVGAPPSVPVSSSTAAAVGWFAEACEPWSDGRRVAAP